MNLYLLERTTPVGYDQYDSIVVVSNSEEEARLIPPDETDVWKDDAWRYKDGREAWSGWENPKLLKVTLIGKADKSLKSKVIIKSFNAG